MRHSSSAFAQTLFATNDQGGASVSGTKRAGERAESTPSLLPLLYRHVDRRVARLLLARSWETALENHSQLFASGFNREIRCYGFVKAILQFLEMEMILLFFWIGNMWCNDLISASLLFHHSLYFIHYDLWGCITLAIGFFCSSRCTLCTGVYRSLLWFLSERAISKPRRTARTFLFPCR